MKSVKLIITVEFPDEGIKYHRGIIISDKQSLEKPTSRLHLARYNIGNIIYNMLTCKYDKSCNKSE